MEAFPLTSDDRHLIERAKQVIATYYRRDRHHVGAALRTTAGTIFTAVHVEANVGRITVCAEAIVIGKAISEGAAEFDTIVAVRRADDDPHTFYVVFPCGMCREMICDYGPMIKVLFVEGGELKKVLAGDLLPGKHTREQRSAAV
jgi:cytidine deaminase